MSLNGKWRPLGGWSRSVICDLLLAVGVIVAITLSVIALCKDDTNAINALKDSLDKNTALRRAL